MHKKISVGLSLSITILAVIVSIVITVAVTMNAYTSIIGDLPERERMYDTLSQIDSLVRSNFFENTDASATQTGAAEGYIEALAGTNALLTQEEYEAYKNRIAGVGEDMEKLETVSSQVYGSVGYIKISDFCDATAADFESAAEKLVEQSVTGIVIDVRGCYSLNIDSAAEVIDCIVPLASVGNKAIAVAQGADGENKKIFPADADSINLTFGVLIDSGTGGAGELLACDIRDFGKGAIVGTTSMGIGTYCEVFELTDYGALILSTAKLLPYTSECFDGVGVVPDYEIQGQPAESLADDAQFMHAHAYITSVG